MEMTNLKCFGKIHFSELFPTKWSGFIFVSYMALFVNQGLLVTATQKSDYGYHYNTVLAVMMTEVIKLAASLVLYLKDHSVLNLVHDVRSHVKVMYKYFVPAFLYCLYNNLAFVNLSVFDPTTYYLLLQLRVVITGVLFQVLFNKHLSRKQWFSLMLLTAGCMVKELPLTAPAPVVTQPSTDTDVLIKAVDKGMAPFFSWNMLLIIVQVVCSCLAGVYNELLLKSSDTETCNIYIQNVFMYADSILCNMAVLGLQGDLSVLLDTSQLINFFDIKVILVVVNNAAIGIVTSFFLRSMNSILKTFASALELVFTAVLTWMIFNMPIHWNTACAIFIVSMAVVMYSQNPVVNVKTFKETSYKEVSSV